MASLSSRIADSTAFSASMSWGGTRPRSRMLAHSPPVPTQGIREVAERHQLGSGVRGDRDDTTQVERLPKLDPPPKAIERLDRRQNRPTPTRSPDGCGEFSRKTDSAESGLQRTKSEARSARATAAGSAVSTPPAFTVTLNSATTSLRRRIATVCSPTVLIGSVRTILRRSTSRPFSAKPLGQVLRRDRAEELALVARLGLESRAPLDRRRAWPSPLRGPSAPSRASRRSRASGARPRALACRCRAPIALPWGTR